MEQLLGAPLEAAPAPPSPPLTERERDYLTDTARDLYWNELEWEKLTHEERLDQGFMTELAFPGFLAFIRGLLLEEAMPDSPAPPRPSPEVVEDLLAFLASRVVELEEESSLTLDEEATQRQAELKMTSRLVDLVLYLLHDLGPEDVGKIEAALDDG